MKNNFILTLLALSSLSSFAIDQTAVFKVSGTAKDGWNQVVVNRYSDGLSLKICVSRHFNILNSKGKIKYEIAGSTCNGVETDGAGNFATQFVTGLPSHKKNETAVPTATYIYGVLNNSYEETASRMTPKITEGTYDNSGGSFHALFERD